MNGPDPGVWSGTAELNAWLGVAIIIMVLYGLGVIFFMLQRHAEDVDRDPDRAWEYIDWVVEDAHIVMDKIAAKGSP